MNSTEISIPLSPTWTWGIVLLASVIIASLILSVAIKDRNKAPAVDRLMQAMGLGAIASQLFFFAALIWLALFFLLVTGLFAIIVETVTLFRDPNGDWRLSLVKLTALTATTGALITLPLTLWRTTIVSAQTETAQAALFNTKIDTASAGLTARHTVTRRARNVTFDLNGENDSGLDVWGEPFDPPDDATNIKKGDWIIISEEEPDLVTRATAVDRLEGLVHERPEEAARVASLLCVYIREHAKEVPPVDYGEGRNPSALWHITELLGRTRSDLEKAAQTVGRIKKIPGVAADTVMIDLRSANLQTFDLSDTDFSGAQMSGVHLQGAKLNNANFDHAILLDAHLQGAIAFEVSMKNADLERARLQGATFTFSNFYNARLDATDLRGIDLQSANLQKATLLSANLNGAIISKAKLQDTNLRSAKLENAVLDQVELDEETRFKKAQLNGSTVRGTDLTDAPRITSFVEVIFGDKDTILPGGDSIESPHWPEHWPKSDLKFPDFKQALEDWRATLPSNDT